MKSVRVVQMQACLFRVARLVSALMTSVTAYWEHLRPTQSDLTPHRQYFLGEEEFDPSYTRVPEDTIYIEEWVQNGVKRCVVRYEGEEIPTSWEASPFDTEPKRPWIWVGDKDTEIDLTRTFDKFLVVGNRITLDLVLRLIQVTDRTNLLYIEVGSFKELKFPGDGITIEAYVDSKPL
jgi:hypothetical protein